MNKLQFGRYSVEITHQDKVLFPPGITKGDLITYYARIAPIMVPYLQDRPLMMHRFPEGIYGQSFYQKDASSYFPPWIQQAQIPKEGGFNNYVICQNQATLVYLANQACITPHVWLSRIDKLYYPDRMIFDLDPSEGIRFSETGTIALSLFDLLEELGLTSFVMTTGSRGLHVLVPLKRIEPFESVKLFAHQCAQVIVGRHPDLATLELRKEKRGRHIFIDTLRNNYAATAVAPYAVRAKPNAPVATPLYWKELDNRELTAQAYTIDSLFKRLKELQDPWKNLKQHARSIKTAQKIITNILKKVDY